MDSSRNSKVIQWFRVLNFYHQTIIVKASFFSRLHCGTHAPLSDARRKGFGRHSFKPFIQSLNNSAVVRLLLLLAARKLQQFAIVAVRFLLRLLQLIDNRSPSNPVLRLEPHSLLSLSSSLSICACKLYWTDSHERFDLARWFRFDWTSSFFDQKLGFGSVPIGSPSPEACKSFAECFWGE